MGPFCINNITVSLFIPTLPGRLDLEGTALVWAEDLAMELYTSEYSCGGVFTEPESADKIAEEADVFF